MNIRMFFAHVGLDLEQVPPVLFRSGWGHYSIAMDTVFELLKNTEKKK